MVCIIFGVAGAMIAGILHSSMVALVLCILFNPKPFESMPLYERQVRVKPCILTQFVLELACILDAGKCRFD